MSHATEVVRECFRAYEESDRELLERLIAEEYRFWSPLDPGLDRATYLERCWPNAGNLRAFELETLVADGDRVYATYEATRNDGTRFRNTELHAVAGGKLVRTEVYFGWDLPHPEA